MRQRPALPMTPLTTHRELDQFPTTGRLGAEICLPAVAQKAESARAQNGAGSVNHLTKQLAKEAVLDPCGKKPIFVL